MTTPKKPPPKGKPSVTSPTTPPAPTDAPPKLTLLTPAAAYARHLAAAQAFTGDLEPCRADLPVVLSNVKFGVTNVLPHFPTMPRCLPDVPREQVLELPNVVLGLMHAAERVTAGTSRKADMDRHLATARKWREPMLLVAEALALLGIFPADRVAKIREGTGSYDTAQDALALVALYREYATTVAGKHPFTDADFAAAEEAGTWLVEHITPAGGRAPTPDPAAKEAARVRDQFWALVRDRYVALFRAGSYYYTDRVAQFVPPLQSRVVVAKPDGGDPEPPPEPPPKPE